MAIQTSDGQVYADSTEFLKASIYDPNHAEHSQPDLNNLFDQLSTQPESTQVDPNENTVQDKNHSDSGQFQVAGDVTQLNDLSPSERKDWEKSWTNAVTATPSNIDAIRNKQGYEGTIGKSELPGHPGLLFTRPIQPKKPSTPVNLRDLIS